MIDFSKIALNYAVKSDRLGQKYPALQATSYLPQSLSEQLGLCLSDTSFELLSPEAQSWLQTEVKECRYRRDSVLMYQLVSPVRWVFLTLPKIFIFDKKTKQVSYPERGVKLAGTQKVTICQCFLACLIEDNLVLDLDGLPQIFTLKLTSNKTQLIGYLNDKESTTTLVSLNQDLQKHFKSQNNFIHLLSLKLAPKPKEFVSSYSGESSFGITFEIDDEPQALSPSQQQQIFDLINLEAIQTLFDDPFGLKKHQVSPPQSIVNTELIDSSFETPF